MALEPGVDLPTCGFFKPVRWLIVYRIGKISSMESDLAAIPADKSNFAESLQSRLVLLKSRLEKRLDAVESRLLVTWEQEQITELVKFFPADQLATRDTGALSTRSTGPRDTRVRQFAL